MANMLPTFVAAPRCKIQLNGVDIAYAIGLSVNVRVNVEMVKILGEFATVSIEPLQYLPVEGSLQVIRLLSKPTQDIYKDEAQIQKTKLVKDNTKSFVENPGSTNSILGQSLLNQHLDPATILASKTFDIMIELKIPKIKSDLSLDVSDPANLDFTSAFLTIKDCRIQNMSASISANRIFSEPLDFVGLLAQNSAAGVNLEALDSIVKDGVKA